MADDDARSGATLGPWSDKSATERTLLAGIHGAPELKQAERRQFLGEFRERVLASIAKTVVAKPTIDKGVAAAVKDPRAVAVIVDASVRYEDASKYRELAAEHGLGFTVRGDPSFRGDVGLIVVSDHAVS